MPDKRFDELALRYLDGMLSTAEATELADRLRQDEECRDSFVGLCVQVAMLGEGTGDEISAGSATGDSCCTASVPAVGFPIAAPESRTPVLGFLGSVRSWTNRNFTSPRGLLLVVVGCLSAYFLSVMALIPLSQSWINPVAANRPIKVHSTVDEEGPMAQIVRQTDVVWEQQQLAFANEEWVTAGTLLQLRGGILELQFESGARVVLHGPVAFRVDGLNAGRLDRGELLASVPPEATGFAIETASARIVDLGTEFGVFADESGHVNVHVIKGAVEVTQTGEEDIARLAQPIEVKAGNAVRVSSEEAAIEPTQFAGSRFSRFIEPAVGTAAREPFKGEIPLGNLFDDRAPTSLADAVASDTFGAAPDRDHLAIERVYTGGDSIKEIAPGIRFEMKPLGWLGLSYSPPVNDGVCLEQSLPNLPIQTLGKELAQSLNPIEDGIGMHADSVITFNLNELRAAGALAGTPLQFVSDRVGLNDDSLGRSEGSVHCLAILSDDRRVLAAYLNGVSVKVAAKRGVYELVDSVGKPLATDGKFPSFAADVPLDARYLTLVVAAAGDNIHSDHGVWSGCRLVPQDDKATAD